MTKWPTPRPVCFSAETDSIEEETLSRSPRTRGRRYSCSQLVATTEVKPPSSRRCMSSSAGLEPSQGSARGAGLGQLGGGLVAAHDPGLEHGGRGDDPGEPVGPGRGVVQVDGVLVPHGLDPVADHGLVDGVGALGRGAHRRDPRRPAGGPGSRPRRLSSVRGPWRSSGRPGHPQAGHGHDLALDLVHAPAEGVDLGVPGRALEAAAPGPPPASRGAR